MISTKMQEELNQRINDEFYAAYLYLAMAAYFEAINLKGFGQWMRAQFKEEQTHALKNYNYLLERGGKVSLKPLGAVPDVWPTPLAAAEAALGHEQKVTKIYGQFIELARAEKDHATEIFLQWFLSEQVEEEAQTLEIVEKLRQIKDSIGGLFALDHQLGKRE
jgi:ferritin